MRICSTEVWAGMVSVYIPVSIHGRPNAFSLRTAVRRFSKRVCGVLGNNLPSGKGIVEGTLKTIPQNYGALQMRVSESVLAISSARHKRFESSEGW